MLRISEEAGLAAAEVKVGAAASSVLRGVLRPLAAHHRAALHCACDPQMIAGAQAQTTGLPPPVACRWASLPSAATSSRSETRWSGEWRGGPAVCAVFSAWASRWLVVFAASRAWATEPLAAQVPGSSLRRRCSWLPLRSWPAPCHRRRRSPRPVPKPLRAAARAPAAARRCQSWCIRRCAS